MSELSKIVVLTPDELKTLLREAVAEALNGSQPGSSDRLLTPEAAAEMLQVNPRWLYRHAKKLPFTRRLSRKNLRFSEAGLLRWQAAKKNA